MQPEHSENEVMTHHEAALVTSALIILLVMCGGYYLYSHMNATAPISTPVHVTKQTPTTTKVTQTPNLHPTTLPAGFPRDIPVEVNNLTESTATMYPQGTLYSVSYTTSKTKDALWTLYTDYVNQAGYKIVTAGTSKTQGTISTTSGKSQFRVIISAATKGLLVQVVYLKAN